MKLEVSGVGKWYREGVWGVRDFTLDAGPGVVGLLGPNGAGKSTLMRILATVTPATEGRVTWNGVDVATSPDAVRRVLGYLPQDFGVYPNLSPLEFLRYLAAARGIGGATATKRIEQLLELVNLVGARRRPLGSLSGGMKQRVGIAQALLNDPKLLIVDEPTAGLDLEERARFRNLLTELAGDRIVILSSHIVTDIEAIATSVAIIKRGHLQFHGPPEDLLRHVQGRSWELTIPSTDLPEIRKRCLISSSVRTGEGVRLRVVGDEPPAPHARGIQPTLEDAYLYLLTARESQKN